jgi:hypothetical protein
LAGTESGGDSTNGVLATAAAAAVAATALAGSPPAEALTTLAQDNRCLGAAGADRQADADADDDEDAEADKDDDDESEGAEADREEEEEEEEEEEDDDDDPAVNSCAWRSNGGQGSSPCSSEEAPVVGSNGPETRGGSRGEERFVPEAWMAA